MKLQFCSDLHLEFLDNRRWLEKNPLRREGEILVVAGDTDYLGAGFGEKPIFDWLAEAFEQVYFLPGNHEYYRGYDAGQPALHWEIRPNCKLVNNQIVDLGTVELVFSTLWSRIRHFPLEVYKGLMDFRRISFRGEPLTIATYNSLHDECWSFLQEAIRRERTKPRVVVTHHLPSEQCSSSEFAGSRLNEGFVNNLTAAIEEAEVDYWIFGHSHRNKPPFRIGRCWMLTNQLGYVGMGEHLDFDPGAYIEIGDEALGL